MEFVVFGAVAARGRFMFAAQQAQGFALFPQCHGETKNCQITIMMQDAFVFDDLCVSMIASYFCSMCLKNVLGLLCLVLYFECPNSKLEMLLG